MIKVKRAQSCLAEEQGRAAAGDAISTPQPHRCSDDDDDGSKKIKTNKKIKSQSTTAGFEPTRAEHTTVLKSLLRPLGHVVTMGRHFFDIPYVHTW